MRTIFIPADHTYYQYIIKASHVHVTNGAICVRERQRTQDGYSFSTATWIKEGESYKVQTSGWLCLISGDEGEVLLELAVPVWQQIWQRVVCMFEILTPRIE